MNGVKFAIVSSILMLIISETSEARQKEWWETTTIYQIYTRSFKDSDGDGVGDLNGIYEKLDYLKDIGVETIWIQPFFKSPMADLGYDVADFKQIEPMFGTMDDFKRLIAGIHERGMKLLLDMVPNHVSDKNEWFTQSVNKVEPYTDYFIWRDPKGFDSQTKKPLPPNNWLSVFGGSAWEWNEKRQQFYYKQFSAKQPDLNFRNRKVREAIEDAMRFWLDLGADGFRIDAIRHLIEAEHMKDEPYKSPAFEGSLNYDSMFHIYSRDQEETYEVTHEWRTFLDDYSKKDNHSRIIATEAYARMSTLMKYFGNETYKKVHFPFYFGFVKLNLSSSAAEFDRRTHAFIDQMPAGGVANWVVSNHDNSRLATRISPVFTDAMNMLELLLPGVASVYYGDEIGMEDSLIRKDQIQDPNNAGGVRADITRDPERGPMQWDDSVNAGFTNNKAAWLPLNPDYFYKNVKMQSAHPQSHLNTFKRLIALRKSPVIRDGLLETCVISKWVYMYTRRLEGEAPVAVIVNLGSESESACTENCNNYLPDPMHVHAGSINSGFKPGDEFSVTNHSKPCSMLRPKAGVVLTSSGHSLAVGVKLMSFSSLSVMLLLMICIIG